MTTFCKQRNNERYEIIRARNRSRRLRASTALEEETMTNYSRWEDVKNRRPAPSEGMHAGIVHDLALGQLVVSFPEQIPADLKDAVRVA